MRHLVIGGAGFLGAHVCARLLGDGEEPIAFDTNTSNVLQHVVGEEVARDISVHGDATDGPAVLNAAKSRGADTIIHLAAMQGHGTNRDPWAALRVNCGSFINALEAVRILGLRRVVWASSVAVYHGYREGDVVRADSPYTPRNIYGGTKLLCELLAKQYAEAHGVDSAGFRFPLMVGPGRELRRMEPAVIKNGTPITPTAGLWEGILTELIGKPAGGKPGRVPFGDDVANWLWVEDSARAVALAACSSLDGARVYNICGDVRPVRDAVAAVRRLIPGADIEAMPGRNGAQPTVDTRAIRDDLGFEVTWRMEEQLAALIANARLTAAPG